MCARQPVLAHAVAEYVDARRGGHLPQRHRDEIPAALHDALSGLAAAVRMSRRQSRTRQRPFVVVDSQRVKTQQIGAVPAHDAVDQVPLVLL